MRKIQLLGEKNINVLTNMLGAFIIKGASLIVSVALLPMYLRFFDNQEVLGVWYTILSVLNWIILFDFGLGQGLRNQLPEALVHHDKKLAQEYISTTYILMIIFAVLITLLGIIIIPQINLYSIFNIDHKLISQGALVESTLIVFVGIMLQIVLKIITSILYAMQKSATVNILALFSNLLILVSLVFLPRKDIGSNLIIMSWVNIIAANFPYIICTIVVFAASKELKGAYPSIKAFSKKYIKNIFNIGIALLWLQIVFMLVSSANEFLISNLLSPKYVIEYQAYYKIFKTAAMIVSLALTPIWSAVTKAHIEKDFIWIKKMYIIFLVLSFLCFLGELCMIPWLQSIVNIWLGKNIVKITSINAFIFALSSMIFMLHNVNTSIGNGLSFFKIQMIWMTFAAIVFIPLSILFARISNEWISIVACSIIAMAPYEFLAPYYTIKYLNNELKENKIEKSI